MFSLACIWCQRIERIFYLYLHYIFINGFKTLEEICFRITGPLLCLINFRPAFDYIICFSVTETHQVAEAQQEKNARLREAFGISEYFVDGSSFDPDRQAKEKLAKSVALIEKEKQEAIEREKERGQEKAQATRYQLVHTPSPEPPPLPSKESTVKKKKRKHRNR